MSPQLRRSFRFAAMICLLCSCSPPPAVTEWPFQKEAVTLRLDADPMLNLFQGSPHALFLCLYQLRDPNSFNQLAGEPGGLEKLLECGRFDPAVTITKRVVIQPRQKVEEALDRAEGARYLGVVAGYYHLRRERALRLIAVPVSEQTDGWFWRRRTIARPGKVVLDLRLRSQEIAENDRAAAGERHGSKEAAK